MRSQSANWSNRFGHLLVPEKSPRFRQQLAYVFGLFVVLLVFVCFHLRCPVAIPRPLVVTAALALHQEAVLVVVRVLLSIVITFAVQDTLPRWRENKGSLQGSRLQVLLRRNSARLPTCHTPQAEPLEKALGAVFACTMLAVATRICQHLPSTGTFT